MSARAWYSTTTRSAHSAYDAGGDYADLDVSPGERIGQPLGRSRGKAILRGLVVIVCLAGGGWAIYGDPSAGPRWWSVVTEAASPAIEQAVQWSSAQWASLVTPPGPSANSEPTPRLAALETPLPPLQASPPSTAATTPGAAPEPAVSTITTAALPPTATGVEELPAPPKRGQAGADPNLKRAEAVGLHPELSRVLLARLTETDYRNAGVAIQTAVAETPDNAVYIWPRQRKSGLALFQISFVPGAAAPDCRRYVVTIAKDGWLTTALPMEKCGVPRQQAQRQ